jgi:hypothetical protein
MTCPQQSGVVSIHTAKEVLTYSPCATYTHYSSVYSSLQTLLANQIGKLQALHSPTVLSVVGKLTIGTGTIILTISGSEHP